MQGLPKEVCIKWCKDHEFTLSKHKRCFIAVCLERGVLVSTAGEKEFIKELYRKVPIAERHRIFVTHTSEFISDLAATKDNLTAKEAHNIRKKESVAEGKQLGNPWNSKATRKNGLKNNLVIDFDNIIYPLNIKLEGFDVLNAKPTDGAIEFLKMIANHYKIVIVSIRVSHPKGIQAIKNFLILHGIQKHRVDEIKFSNKAHAKIKIEDLKRWKGKFPSLNELYNNI